MSLHRKVVKKERSKNADANNRDIEKDIDIKWREDPRDSNMNSKHNSSIFFKKDLLPSGLPRPIELWSERLLKRSPNIMDGLNAFLNLLVEKGFLERQTELKLKLFENIILSFPDNRRSYAINSFDAFIRERTTDQIIVLKLLKALRNECQRDSKTVTDWIELIFELPYDETQLKRMLSLTLNLQDSINENVMFCITSMYQSLIEIIKNEKSAVDFIERFINDEKTSSWEQLESCERTVQRLKYTDTKIAKSALEFAVRLRELPLTNENLEKWVSLAETSVHIIDIVESVSLILMSNNKEKMLSLLSKNGFVAEGLQREIQLGLLKKENISTPENVLENYLKEGKIHKFVTSDKLDYFVKRNPSVLDNWMVEDIKFASFVLGTTFIGEFIDTYVNYKDMLSNHRLPVIVLNPFAKVGILTEEILSRLEEHLPRHRKNDELLLKELHNNLNTVLERYPDLFPKLFSLSKENFLNVLRAIAILREYETGINSKTLSNGTNINEATFIAFLNRKLIRIFAKVFELNNKERALLNNVKESWLSTEIIHAFLRLRATFKQMKDKNLLIFLRKIVRKILRDEFREWRIGHKGGRAIYRFLGKHGFKVWTRVEHETIINLEEEKKGIIRNTWKGIVSRLDECQDVWIKRFTEACKEGNMSKIESILSKKKLKSKVNEMLFEEIEGTAKKLRNKIVHIPSHIALEENDDPLRMVHVGIVPVPTCLSWRVPNLKFIGALLSYIADTNKRLFIMKSPRGKPIARCIVRLDTYKKCPLIIIERVYGLLRWKSLYKHMFAYIVNKAKELKKATGKTVYLGVESTEARIEKAYILEEELRLFAKKQKLILVKLEGELIQMIERAGPCDYSDSLIMKDNGKRAEAYIYVVSI